MMNPLRACKTFFADRSGASAAEFVLVLAPLIVLILGGINVSVMVYTASALRFAAEDAARCAAVKSDVCSDAASTNTYALTKYKGPGSDADFVLTADTTCGDQVTGSVTYNFATGLTTTPMTITASACYAN